MPLLQLGSALVPVAVPGGGRGPQTQQSCGDTSRLAVWRSGGWIRAVSVTLRGSGGEGTPGWGLGHSCPYPPPLMVGMLTGSEPMGRLRSALCSPQGWACSRLPLGLRAAELCRGLDRGAEWRGRLGARVSPCPWDTNRAVRGWLCWGQMWGGAVCVWGGGLSLGGACGSWVWAGDFCVFGSCRSCSLCALPALGTGAAWSPQPAPLLLSVPLTLQASSPARPAS